MNELQREERGSEREWLISLGGKSRGADKIHVINQQYQEINPLYASRRAITIASTVNTASTTTTRLTTGSRGSGKPLQISPQCCSTLAKRP